MQVHELNCYGQRSTETMSEYQFQRHLDALVEQGYKRTYATRTKNFVFFFFERGEEWRTVAVRAT